RARAARGPGGDADYGGFRCAAVGTVPGERLGQHEGAGDVHREHSLPGRRGHVEQRPVWVGRGVVDEDVRLPELADRRAENLFGEPGLGDVLGDLGDLRVAGEEVRRRQVGDHYLSVFIGEGRGDGPADAVGAAADDGHLAGETALSNAA